MVCWLCASIAVISDLRSPRTSATNCARLYNVMFANHTPPDGWFGFTVTPDHVWDGFVLLALLEDCESRHQRLILPHTGLQRDCFHHAMHSRNLRFRLYHQPESRHYCSKCMRIYTGPEGPVIVWVVVIDGITIGHPCCLVHNCFVPLPNNRQRYCTVHAASHDAQCAIIGCTAHVMTGRRTCSDPTHQAVETLHHDRGQARFQLKERLARALVAHPQDSSAEEQPLSELVDTEEIDEEYEVPVSQLEGPEQPQRQKLRAQFGRRRTHNEQIIVAPCGIIIARETFYGAEGVASVVVSFWRC